MNPRTKPVSVWRNWSRGATLPSWQRCWVRRQKAAPKRTPRGWKHWSASTGTSPFERRHWRIGPRAAIRAPCGGHSTLRASPRRCVRLLQHWLGVDPTDPELRLRTLLVTGDEKLRAAVAQVARDLEPRPLALLRRRLVEDESLEVRLHLCHALRAPRDGESRQLLEEVAADRTQPGALREAAAKALRDLGMEAPRRPARPKYMGREIAPVMGAEHAAWLTRPEREREESCAQLLEALGVEPGDRVCDLGCGNGYYTLRLAQRVGDAGEVVAVDIQPRMLELLHQRADSAGLASRVRTVLGTETDPRLEPESLDLCLMVDVYHEFDDPEAMLAAIHRALDADGEVVLAEFRAEDPKVPIRPEHKMTRSQVLRELGANGFVFSREYTELPWQHLMFFRKAAR